MSRAEQMMEQKRTDCAMEEALLAAICDICVHPFCAADQDALDRKCEDCPVIALTMNALRKQYACGYTQGMYDAARSIRDAYASVGREINERYKPMDQTKTGGNADAP